ncbi:unnamed protein product [Ostreobium quekettii]|uniref:Uncharacterized protein n=1 Tax=Ostreobium quekettii TaxID=121088 RepID=A0A8S1J168_9CHLO|nr:unnamed protein product [Ostreobium quekettii]
MGKRGIRQVTQMTYVGVRSPAENEKHQERMKDLELCIQDAGCFVSNSWNLCLRSTRRPVAELDGRNLFRELRAEKERLEEIIEDLESTIEEAGCFVSNNWNLCFKNTKLPVTERAAMEYSEYSIKDLQGRVHDLESCITEAGCFVSNDGSLCLRSIQLPIAELDNLDLPKDFRVENSELERRIGDLESTIREAGCFVSNPWNLCFRSTNRPVAEMGILTVVKRLREKNRELEGKIESLQSCIAKAGCFVSKNWNLCFKSTKHPVLTTETLETSQCASEESKDLQRRVENLESCIEEAGCFVSKNWNLCLKSTRRPTAELDNLDLSRYLVMENSRLERKLENLETCIEGAGCFGSNNWNLCFESTKKPVAQMTRFIYVEDTSVGSEDPQGRIKMLESCIEKAECFVSNNWNLCFKRTKRPVAEENQRYPLKSLDDW